jgi:hypothetical protein
MGSLDGKLEQLTPEDRKLVEDFVNLLIQRAFRQSADSLDPVTAPPVPAIAPPPLLIVQEPPPAELPAVSTGSGVPRPDMMVPAVHIPEHGAPPAFLELGQDTGDLLTTDYMDYGKFEQKEKIPPSPADAAVQRVKIRLNGKKGKDPTHNLLEWID